MTIEFDVQMTTQKMYDYMLFHTFRSFSGIMGEIVGILLIAAYFVAHRPLYLIAGIVVVFYLPVALYLNAKKQVTLNPVFKTPLHYILDDEINQNQFDYEYHLFRPNQMGINNQYHKLLSHNEQVFHDHEILTFLQEYLNP